MSAQPVPPAEPADRRYDNGIEVESVTVPADELRGLKATADAVERLAAWWTANDPTWLLEHDGNPVEASIVALTQMLVTRRLIDVMPPGSEVAHKAMTARGATRDVTRQEGLGAYPLPQHWSHG
jgi:hypothetical protein